MAVFRVHKTKNYTLMSNHHLRDKNLSLKAKGLLSVMFSLPDTWNYSIPGLCSILKENETAVKSTIKELKQTGYLIVDKKKPCKEEGRSKFEYVYNIYETPQEIKENSDSQGNNFQGIENLPLELPEVEDHPHNKRTDISNTDESITDIGNNKDFISKENKESKTSNYGELEGGVPSPKKKKKSSKYRDEDLSDMLEGKLSKAFFRNYYEYEYTSTHHALATEVVHYFFKEYKKFFNQQHEMITDEYAEIILARIARVSSEMEEAGIDSTDQYVYYHAMVDEFFKSDYGKNSGTYYDKKIYLFFSEGNQAILFARIKDKFQSKLY